MSRDSNSTPSNPNKYLMDFCDSPREDDQDFDFQLVSLKNGFCETITLTQNDGRDRNTELLDCWNKEYIDANGTEGYYFSLDLEKSIRDPLYDEAVHVWKGPYELKIQVKKPEKTVTAREEGLEGEFSAELYIARAEIEEKCVPRPKEGDIVLFWNLPFFANFGSLSSRDLANAGWYYDITRVTLDGHMTDGPHFAGFELEAFRRTAYTPERKIYGDGPPRLR
jgi:hypothetical protein